MTTMAEYRMLDLVRFAAQELGTNKQVICAGLIDKSALDISG